MPVTVTGPDQKQYQFPDGTTKDHAIAYFKSKGITGASMSNQPPITSAAGVKSKFYDVVDKFSNALPSAGGIVGGLVGGALATPADMIAGPAPTMWGAVAGSALGGAAGEAGRQAVRAAVFPNEKQPPASDRMKKIMTEGATQGLSEMSGQVVGRLVGPTITKTVKKLAYASGLKDPRDLEGLETVIVDLTNAANSSKKPETVGAFRDLIKSTERSVNNEVGLAMRQQVMHDGKMVPLSGIEVDANPIADRVLNLTKSHITEPELNPSKISAFKKEATIYQKPRSFEWLNDRRIVLNNELRNFYQLQGSEKAHYLFEHPELEAYKQEVDAIRDIIYPMMDKASGKIPGYFENLQARHGSLMSLNKAVDKQVGQLKLKSAVNAGAPWYERTNASAYETSSGKPGFGVHRIQSIIKAKNPEKIADKRVASAFGATARSKVAKAASTDIGMEILALPIRYLTSPDGEEETQPPVGPKTRSLQEKSRELRQANQ